MFTQCPNCKKVYSLSDIPDQSDKTLLHCDACSKDFNVMELFSENNPTGLLTEAKAEFIAKTPTKKTKAKSRKKLKKSAVAAPQANDSDTVNAITPALAPETLSPHIEERLPWEIERPPSRINWHLATWLSLAVLLSQLIYFEAGKLSQNANYRPYLEKVCLRLACQLTDYKNISELELLQSSSTSTNNNTITFKVVISNQALFKQRLPNIKLNLHDFQEQIFAQRMFKPADYLANNPGKSTVINPDEAVEINLTINKPSTLIAGYTFDLLY
jgi:Protein of unknown function (DUF3426)